MINDDNFISGIREKDEKALEYAIDKYTGIVSSVINKILQGYSIENREECVSDVFVSVWWNIDRFNGDVNGFKNWICTVARFKAIDYYRSLLKEENVTPINIPISPDVLDEIITNENKKEVVKLLKNLSKEDRNIFSMRFFLGMKVKDIALKMNLSESIVSNRIYKGKQKIKKSLDFKKFKEVSGYEKA